MTNIASEVVLGNADTETKANYITVRTPYVPPEPGKFSASYLHISPQQVLPNQWVEISINIANHGEERGSHTVTLYINGYAADSQTVGVSSPGGTQLVVFRVRMDSGFFGGIYTGPGTYQVNVEGQKGQFMVLAPGPPPSSPAAPPAPSYFVVVVIALIVAIVFLFRATRRE